MPYCKIVLTNSLQTFSDLQNNSLSYEIPETLVDKVSLGSLVLVPFRNQKENGLVIDIYNSLSEAEKKFKIRSIEDLISEDFYFTEELIEIIKFTAEYYCCSYTEVVSGILGSGRIAKPDKTIELVNDSGEDHPVLIALRKARKKTASWSRLKTLTKLNEESLKKEIRKFKNLIEIKFSRGKSKRESLKLNPIERLKQLSPDQIPELSQEQAVAVTTIRAEIDKNSQARFLLHGVTGSGKTEIYLRLIEDAFKRNQSSIFLIPEIAMAPQLSERVAQRFGKENVLIWHSALSKSERDYTFAEIITGEPKVIVGARSAIFAPVKNLGLIILDEEHENSYKQDSPAPRYHARIIAEKRSELNNCPLILGSATPSVEVYYQAEKQINNYHLLKLTKRVFNNPLPEVKIIDMREEFNNANKSIFSRFLKSRMEETLERKEQIILFLNKRGSASHVFCRNCGYIYKCSHCDAKTVYHQDQKQMLCHHCGYAENHPDTCPVCDSRAIKFFGLGTQKLEEEVIKQFPDASVQRLDSDVARRGYIDIWNDFREGKIDILIGTQMIAKGLDNPNITTVGVVLADSNFSQIDYIADERGFQLLTQVSGRAGRRDKKGLVVFQSYQPDREALLESQKQNYEEFYQREIKLREEFQYPPFSRIIRFLISGENEVDVIQRANIIHEKVFNIKGPNILGPCPALISKINKKFRYHIILKIPNEHLAAIEDLKQIYFSLEKDSKTSTTIDVDSISLY